MKSLIFIDTDLNSLHVYRCRNILTHRCVFINVCIHGSVTHAFFFLYSHHTSDCMSDRC
uniref:Uncharacterized protein n=1 Tax=Octopus bimaculoides TaxID=37653 RepID=A0A0L8FNK9_OCTBM